MEREGWRKTGGNRNAGDAVGNELRRRCVVMTCGEGDDDNRRVHRYIPGEGFDDIMIDCPDDTGSHLALYGGRVSLGNGTTSVCCC